MCKPQIQGCRHAVWSRALGATHFPVRPLLPESEVWLIRDARSCSSVVQMASNGHKLRQMIGRRHQATSRRPSAVSCCLSTSCLLYHRFRD
eukprot:6195726-Pleurochrysis_carterae.AAC.1